MDNDLISRELALKTMCENCLPKSITCDEECSRYTAVSRLPGVGAETVRHGAWIEISRFIHARSWAASPLARGHWIAVGWWDESVTPAKFRRAGYKCSVCARGTAIKSPRCPRCGARMDGGKKDD